MNKVRSKRRSSEKVAKPGRKKSSNGKLLETESLRVVKSAIDKLEAGFSDLPKLKSGSVNKSSFAAIMDRVAVMMRDNYPYFHPLYAGQMLKPPHPIARAAYMMSMWINPNNHALDGGKASSRMEKEAVADLAKMFGWKSHVGHLTGGGTMANLEALWVDANLNPGRKIVASDQAHYTHSRICGVLGIPFETVPSDDRGRMDTSALRRQLARGDIGTVVATIGTTAVGAIDPLPELLSLRAEFGFRLHADAAYGGYFVLAENLDDDARKTYARIGEVDSIVIDPHKHGLQPYGCGCILFHDPTVARFYKHDSPYTYFTSDELHLGEISLECSRAGASAVALWATQKFLPTAKGGEFSKGLEASRDAAVAFHERLENDPRFISPFPPELDIVVWAPRARSTREVSRLSRLIFDIAAKKNLHLAVAELPSRFFHFDRSGISQKGETVTCLRSVLMKPEHKLWVDTIWKILSESTDIALGRSP